MATGIVTIVGFVLTPLSFVWLLFCSSPPMLPIALLACFWSLAITIGSLCGFLCNYIGSQDSLNKTLSLAEDNSSNRSELFKWEISVESDETIPVIIENTL